MILISHRGNIDRRYSSYENEPNYIDLALIDGYDVEVDIRCIDGSLFLGHDEPEYKINLEWIRERKSKIWIHCKNIECLVFFNEKCKKSGNLQEFIYFSHDKDFATMTSNGYVWALPGNQPMENTIAVLPELYNEDVSKCVGICSDYIKKYK